MKLCFKLASNYQTVEFELEAKEEIDGVTGAIRLNVLEYSEALNDIVNIINRLGSIVEASDGKKNKPVSEKSCGKSLKKVEDVKMASDKQIYALKSYGIDGKNMTAKQAWDMMKKLKQQEAEDDYGYYNEG